MFKTMIVKSIGGGWYCPRYTLVILDRPQGGGDALRWLGDATAATEDPNPVGNRSGRRHERTSDRGGCPGARPSGRGDHRP